MEVVDVSGASFTERNDIGLTLDLYRLVFCQVAPLAQ